MIYMFIVVFVAVFTALNLLPTILLVTQHLVSRQVVLPMPGNTVRYPENLLGQWYQERLEQDGLGSSRFRVPALKLNVPGCYRPLLAHAHNLTHTLHTHHGRKEGTHSGDGGQTEQTHTPSLSLSFDLDASCYATVFLREVMRCDL